MLLWRFLLLKRRRRFAEAICKLPILNQVGHLRKSELRTCGYSMSMFRRESLHVSLKELLQRNCVAAREP